MSTRVPAETVLAFGDVIQLGHHAPHSKHMYWGGIDVVQGVGATPGLDTELGLELPNSVQVFPVVNDAEGSPFLETPVTRWGNDVRIFGSLSLMQVRELLVAYGTDGERASAILAHAKSSDAAGGWKQKYQFTPHNETGLRSASYRWKKTKP